MEAKPEPARQLVRLRGRSYVAFVFCPAVPIVGWLEEIDATLASSPGFFAGKPVVLDLSAVDLSQSAIAHLVTNLESRNIRVLGIEGVDAAHLTATMPPLLTGGRHCVVPQNKPEAKPKPTSLLLESPVRSGQSVIFTEGDVTVLGSVGSGAEMAGVNGNPHARIYCQKIEAELLAIDGYYQTAEQIDDTLRNRPAQAWLEGDVMKITPLN
jgi:septum site-determining protein MinC